MSDLPQLHELSEQVMQRDRHRLQRALREVLQNPAPERLARFLRDYQTSQACRTARAQRRPQPSLDPSLPVYERAEEIRDLIQQHQVLILSGETGSGKSTQLPLIALQAGFGIAGMIGHTQPRRIAARSVGQRLADLLGTPLGTDVGYKIRFSDQTGERTLIKLMTDGILLAETQADRFLDQYEMLIIDEAHERSLNIDFVLGFLKNLLPRRPDLKVVITSATIDTERFAQHFASDDGQPAPILHVAGRTFPVDVRYFEPQASEDDADPQRQLVHQCREWITRRDGDILVFLPTEQEIRNVAKKLRGALSGGQVEILPLYSRLSTTQQNQVFRPHTQGRIVLATNVAESSITVPGIRYVIDTGTARISRYAPRTKIQRLPIEPISQASANQRAGRCGRVGPGICLRLYSEEDFRSRPEFTTPEIRRTNLAGTILQLLALGFGDVERFPFIDPPTPEAIRDGYKTLFELGAIDSQRRLTPAGRKLSRLPVDPRIGRMLFAADANNCLHDVLIIAAALELQDPRVRPAEHQRAADAAHQQWHDPASDFMGILRLWDFIVQLKETLSRNRYRTALEQNFLSPTLVSQWQDIHRQLLEMAGDHGLVLHKRTHDYTAIHRSLLTGLLSSIAVLEERQEYLGAGGIKFQIWPGSGVVQSRPQWIVAAEVIETGRRYGRTVATIQPEWIEPIAEHLVKRNQFDPFWSAKHQTVMAYQNTTLFGLPIRVRQRINYTKIDPVASRELFIEKGLVGGELRSELAFYRHNRQLLSDVEGLARKTRQRQLLLDEATLGAFYRQRLPAEAVDVRSLMELLQRRPSLDQELHMGWSDLGLSEEVTSAATQLPDEVRVGSLTVPVEYRFEPGSAEDGACLKVPQGALAQVDDLQLGWLIPGLIEGRITALIRSLPKSLRRNLVPAPEVAKQVATQLKFGEGNFLEAVARALSRLAGEPISPQQFEIEKVDPHLLVNVAVIDDQGQILAQGRSLADLRSQLGPAAGQPALDTDHPEWNRTGLTDWTWEELPQEVPIVRGMTRMLAYPAVMDEGNSVALRLVASPDQAQWLSQRGVARLFFLKQRKLVRSQIQWLPNLEKSRVQIARWIKPDWFVDWLSLKLVEFSMLEGRPPVLSRDEFAARNQRGVELISAVTQDLALWLPKFAASCQDVALAWNGLAPKFADAREDLQRQLAALFSEESLVAIPWRWLQHYPRFLQAIVLRLQKLPAQVELDRQVTAEMRRHTAAYEARLATHVQQGWQDPELMTYRWMLEELRVSKFAQQLGTSLTVSEKRLEKQLSLVRHS